MVTSKHSFTKMMPVNQIKTNNMCWRRRAVVILETMVLDRILLSEVLNRQLDEAGACRRDSHPLHIVISMINEKSYPFK